MVVSCSIWARYRCLRRDLPELKRMGVESSANHGAEGHAGFVAAGTDVPHRGRLGQRDLMSADMLREEERLAWESEALQVPLARGQETRLLFAPPVCLLDAPTWPCPSLLLFCISPGRNARAGAL